MANNVCLPIELHCDDDDGNRQAIPPASAIEQVDGHDKPHKSDNYTSPPKLRSMLLSIQVQVRRYLCIKF